MNYLKVEVNKAIVYSEPGTTNTKIIELPIQAPGPGQVLVRILYSGVCHTDYSLCTNAWKFIPSTVEGQIGGHEGIGKIVAHGQGVSSPPLGTHVGIKYISSACLTCKYCLMGAETNCVSAKISGFFTPGTFQQYCLAPSNYLTPIPETVHEDDLPEFAPLMCAGLAVYTGIKRGEVRSGNWVAISGAGGGLGHLAIQYSKALGAKVIALDVGDKEKLCKEVGADIFIDVMGFEKDEGLSDHVKELTGGGVQIVIGCSSSHRAYTQAMYMLDIRGTLVCLGMPEGEDIPMQGVRLGDMIRKELKIIAVKAGNRLDAIEAVNIAASGKIKTRYQLKKMEELTQVFNEMEEGKLQGRVVLDLR